MEISGTEIRFLVEGSARWINSQRERHHPIGSPLSDHYREAFLANFSAATLDAARIVWVPEIENPDFYAQLGHMPLDFRLMAGITYDDTILLSESQVPRPAPASLIFHEFVHVVQYSVLGVAEFSRQYVMGWAQNGFEYRRIPLESHAYLLQKQFEQEVLAGVDVEPLIRTDLGR